MAEAMQVLVLGYGEMGHAMERLLAARHRLAIWEKYPKAGFHPADLEASVPGAEVIILCLPTRPHEEVLERILPGLSPEALCLSVAKGLDARGRPVARILAETLGPARRYGVLHGPMIAEEIQAGRHAFAQLGHHGSAVVEQVRALFAGSRLHVEPSEDLLGINWAVILKNIYAMAFGMADELGLGDNVRGYLMVAALRELDAIVQRLGGRPGTPYHLAGLGDLVTTATSEHSHHHGLGRRLARGQREGIDGEGVRTLAMARRHGLFPVEDYPLCALVEAALREPAGARARLEALLEGLG